MQQILTLDTPGRGLVDLTAQLASRVGAADLEQGLCHLFVRHTSASLIISENYDPDVQRDLEMFLARLVPDGDPACRHVLEGPDDMAAHMRSVLTASSLSLPIQAGRLALGTWQAVYLWEHRHAGHRREVVLTLQGA